MRQTSSLGIKTGSITLLQARKAVRAVKLAKSGKTFPISASIRERYLGHFGFGPTEPTEKIPSATKKPRAKKTPAK
jgi:hypothetical protein